MIYDSMTRVIVEWLDGSRESEVWQMIRVPAVGETIMMIDGSERKYRVLAVQIAAFRGARESSAADATIGVTST